MRVLERLKRYIEDEIAAGNLHPGDRLPSLRSRTEILGGSYVTMRSAMEKLRNVDEVSYVRFASVYRQFKDINTFMEELDKLLKER